MVAIEFPDGAVGVVAKVALGVVGALLWTSGKGADEARCVVISTFTSCMMHLDTTGMADGPCLQ
jgi:hypothetical protein